MPDTHWELGRVIGLLEGLNEKVDGLAGYQREANGRLRKVESRVVLHDYIVGVLGTVCVIALGAWLAKVL